MWVWVVEGGSCVGVGDLPVDLHSVVVMLCGGNIDTTVLGRSLERGLAADGRLVRFCVRLPDKPGSLQTLSQLLGSQNAR